MAHTPDQTALLRAFRQMLRPLARLALSRGLPHRALDEVLRTALVEEAARLHAETPAHGLVSRVSATTGLNRREASRLLGTGVEPPAPRRWLSGELFVRWMSDPGYLHGGKPRALPRQGATPSFELLARSITRDVHPRTLLDELCRLGLASWNRDDDTVSLQRGAFVPHADFGRLLALMADNVGDHLQAAATNVLGAGDEHFEQALYADELSPESVRALRPLIAGQWAELFRRLVPALEQCIEQDRVAGRPQNQRVRIGFYSFTEPMSPADGEPDPPRGGEAPADGETSPDPNASR
ncbi:MAG: hypothetical protein AMXMBFR52_17090 [Burkholderiales bacterium]|jgi:hypothetical protein|nr:DUF6502 family protein [Burkholderiaceae bacterium]